uniref:Uncharacterized protein n=1 Tax=Arcella intermedia TaxID=1963864 RepID=A0A6B2L7N8_9EUKA
MLIQNGANLNISNSEGKTPLHVSAAKSLVESTAILLKYGSDESRKDNEGKTPLDYAMETEHADSVTLLRLAKLAREEKGEFTTTLLEAVSDIEINFDIRPVHTIKITKEPMTQVPSSPQLPTTSDLISSDTPSTGSRKLPRKERSQGNSILLKYADLMEKMTQEVGENSMQAWGSASQPKAHISSFECIDEGDSFDMLLNEELRKLDADYQPPEGEPKEGELEDEFEEVSETPQRRVIGDRKMKSKQVKNSSPFSQSSPNLPNLPKPPASTRSVRKDTSVLPPIPPTPPASDPASAFGATTDRSQRDEDKTGPSHRDDKPFRTSSFLKKEYKREENFAESRNKSLDRQNFLRRSPSASKSEKKM